jgi:PKHD-type hydroxylase
MELGSFYGLNEVFTRQECERLVVNLDPHVKSSTTVNGDSEVRKSESVMVPRNDANEWIYERLLKVAHETNQAKFRFNIDYNCILGVQFTKYEEGSYYDWHVDTGPTKETCCRKLSITVELSDPTSYKGGNLEFGMNDHNIMKASNDQGSATVFCSLVRHRVTKVTHGKRYSLVVWVTGFPFN